MDSNKLYVGNNIDVLKTFPDNFVDSIITDPPYGLVSITKRFGKDGSAPAKHGKDGSFARLSKGFMGQEWDGSGIEYSVELWSECLRVAKPGAILMAFGGTRTYHRIASAIEDAGWEIIDQICYIYGSGFPKSYDLSKGIDKKFGLKREVVGTRVADDIRSNNLMHARTGDSKTMEYEITEPKSELAKLWDGWKTALKPSLEPICVARKPLDGTNVDNALRWDVCGFNIDGGRIEREIKSFIDGGRKASGTTYNWANTDRKERLYDGTKGGYPSNTILGCYCEGDDHDEDCPIKIMEEQSKGASIYFKNIKYDENLDNSCFLCYNTTCKYNNTEELWKNVLVNYVEKLGWTMEAIAELIAHVNVTLNQSVKFVQNVKSAGNLCDLCGMSIAVALVGIKNLVFSQEELEVILDCTGNYRKCFPIQNLVSFAELWENTDIIPTTTSLSLLFGYVQHVTESYTKQERKEVVVGKSEQSRFLYCSKASKSERNAGLENLVARQKIFNGKSSDSSKEMKDVEARFTTQPQANFHPTVKPLKLMEYLCTLTKTPTGGIVLDPFAGSGTTLVAAINTGRDFIGIELSPEYAEIANARIEHALSLEKQEELF